MIFHAFLNGLLTWFANESGFWINDPIRGQEVDVRINYYYMEERQ